MYSREKSRKNHKNEPSFSSTLLDEIYRSIDTEDSKFLDRDRLVKRHVDCSIYNRVEDGEMTGFRWMEKKENEEFLAEFENKSFQDRDLLCFSSNSTSSDSSGALSSSSDTEFFSSSTRLRASCFSSVARPKPVRINRQEEGLILSNDYKTEDENLFKSKSRALKIYANLRKVKQPISPGGKLTSFINSLFKHANEKKLKTVDSSKGNQVQDSKSIKTNSNCCKNSPESRKKMKNGIQTSVRFDPVSVVLNEGCKSRNGGRYNQLDDLNLWLRVNSRKVEEANQSSEEDAISDSSSDLFELDFGNQQLPVYETTHYGLINLSL